MKALQLFTLLLTVISINTGVVSIATATNKVYLVETAGRSGSTQKLVDEFNRQHPGKNWQMAVRTLTDEEANEFLQTGKVHGAADVVLIKGAGFMGSEQLRQNLAPLGSAVLQNNVPAHLLGENWVVLAKRARIIYFNKSMLAEVKTSLSRYEDLGSPAWRFEKGNGLCLRHADKEYNVSLVRFFQYIKGEAATQEMLRSWIANRPAIKKSDMNGVISSVQEGECAVGLANTYYLGHYLLDKGLSLQQSNIGVLFPNQAADDYGAHVNGKFFAVPEQSNYKAAAVQFLEWFSQPENQNFYANITLEHPVNERAKQLASYPQILKEMGTFRENTSFPLPVAGEKTKESADLMRSLGWKFKQDL